MIAAALVESSVGGRFGLGPLRALSLFRVVNSCIVLLLPLPATK